ncbi:site-2 protease family protein [Kosakonia sacchari]|uniref:Site-2 protease family protein n=1 Tax=Kosakonia sacchari TaxID=1158459 RepID=A0ABZ0MWT4_9ENTR|nr:site-2 protease family protein [Kosakonia sacchari]WOZ79990.1 site-2 protease family protein [Kosakonia sacchari]
MMLTDWLAGFYNLYEPRGWMNLVWGFLMLHLYSALHESGHALMALLLGTRVTRFQTGTPVLGQFTAGGILLQFGIFPGGSVSYAYADDAPRWKVVAAALAGPLFPVLISAPLFLTPVSPYFTHLFGLIVTTGTLLNLCPWMQGTDGQKIVMHLRLMARGQKTLNV